MRKNLLVLSVLPNTFYSPPPPQKKKQSERALARKKGKPMLKFFRNQLTAQLLWECSAIFVIEFVRLSSIFVQDPKIVGPDQTSNRIN